MGPDYGGHRSNWRCLVDCKIQNHLSGLVKRLQFETTKQLVRVERQKLTDV